MDFAQLYDPALDANVGEMRTFNEQFNQRAANAGGDISTPEGLAKARDLNALMGGLFARTAATRATTRQVPGTTIGLRVITPKPRRRPRSTSTSTAAGSSSVIRA